LLLKGLKNLHYFEKDEKEKNKENDKEKLKKHGFMDNTIRKEKKNQDIKKKIPVAKDLVKLSHVEIKKQEVDEDVQDLSKVLKDRLLEHDQFEKLSNEELTILESIMDKRMFLTRIAIIANQSRIPLGIEPFTKDDLLNILNGLIKKGYVIKERIAENDVYYLTERGKYRVQ